MTDERRSPDQIEMDDLREARGRALKLAPAETSLKEVIELGMQIGDVVEGKNKHVVALALLSTYYFAYLRKDQIQMKDLLWFLEEGSFQLAALLGARLDKKGMIH